MVMKALAGENTIRSLPDEFTLSLAAHAPPELARWPALLGKLQVLASDPAAAVSDSLLATAPTIRAVKRPSGVVRS